MKLHEYTDKMRKLQKRCIESSNKNSEFSERYTVWLEWLRKNKNNPELFTWEKTIEIFESCLDGKLPP